MRTKWKKGLSLLLTFVMLLSMLPTTALAASVTIYLSGGNLSQNDTVTVTVNGSSQTATVNYRSWYGYYVTVSIDSPNNKSVTVTHGNYTGSGTIRSSLSGYSADIDLVDPDGGLPIYFFIAEPGENAGADPNGNYEDYPIAPQGTAISTGAAATSATINTQIGIRNASPESIITDYVKSWPSGYTAESFKEFGTINVFDETYSDEEYEIVWVSICKRGDGIPCYCSNAGKHLHIDGALTKKVIIDPAEVTLRKTIPHAQEEDLTFTFELIRLKQDSNLRPTTEVDESFEPLTLTATIDAGKTEANISGTEDTFSFGYYMLMETSSKQWYSNPVYIQVATDGTLKYSNTYNGNYRTASEVVVENNYQEYTITYTDGVEDERIFTDREFTEHYGDKTPEYIVAQDARPGYRFTGWSPAVAETVTDDVTYVAQWEQIPGTLTVEKTFVNLPKALHPDTIDILVTGPDNYQQTLSLDDADYDNTTSTYTWFLTDLLPGDYTVVEDDYRVTGYDWVGGRTDATVLVASDETTTASLTNAYQIQTFTVTYTDGVADEEIFADQTTTEEYGNPTPDFSGSTDREGYFFAGWTPDVADTVTETVTYTAVYAEECTVTYTDGVAGEEIFKDQSTVVAKGDDTPDFDGDPDVRPGYTFDGWKPFVTDTVEATVTYTAQWEPATDTPYTVEHYTQNADGNDWTLQKTEPFTGTTGKTVTAKPISITGYVYDEDCDDNEISGTVAADGSLVLKLYYRPVFTVTWMHDPAVDPQRPLETDHNVMYGTAPSYDKANPSRASDAQNDYHFVGWSTDPNASAENALAETDLPPVTGNVTYYAVFAADPHTFTGTVYVVLDGTANSDGTVKSGTLVDIQTITTDDGYLYLSADGETFYELTRTAEGTYVHTALPVGNYQAYYEKNTASQVCRQYLTITKDYGDRSRGLFYNSVTYDLNGGTLNDSQDTKVEEYYHESSIVRVSNHAPTREGYNFLGWKVSNAGRTLTAGNQLTASISQPYTLVAQWEKAVNVKVIIQIDHKDEAHSGEPDRSETADDVTFTLMRGSVNAASPVTLTSASYTGYDYTSASDLTTYQSDGFAFTGLVSGDYTVYVEKPNYKVVSRKTDFNDDRTEQTITVMLEYVSDSFDLTFQVKMADGVPKALDPRAVNVKVTYWNENAGKWQTVAPLASANPIRIAIGDDRTGTGNYTVDKDGIYRVEVISYEAPNGDLATASTTDGVVYTSINGICIGEVSIEGTEQAPTAGGLFGADFPDDAQNGIPTVTIAIAYGSLTFDPNGGTLDGSTNKLTVSELVRVPDLDAYTPVRDGGYVFTGYTWYKNTDLSTPETALAEGAAIGDHYILVANWMAPIEVSGNIYVEWDVLDPISSVTLLLQRSTVSTADEHFTTIRPMTLDLRNITPTEIGGVTCKEIFYQFTDLENSGIYRIRILANDNFAVTYQNESDGVTPGTNFNSYSPTGNLAVLGIDQIATINAHVNFDPHKVDLPFVIDATAIGTGFQPDAASMEIRYRGATGSYAAYPSEEDQDNPVALTVTRDNIIDSYTFEVVPQSASDTYNFAMQLDSESITAGDDDDTTVPHSNPYYSIVYQNWPAYYQSGRWSGTLTAVLTPKTYAVTYNLDGGHWPDNYTAPESHTWSFDTTIAAPDREDYLFMGWRAEPNDTYVGDKIPAAVHQNVRLTALWEKDELNQNNPTSPTGDDIPDKYQRKVTFKVVNGAWNDQQTTDIVSVVTLQDAEGNLAENGTASITVPAVGEKPAYGYEAGAWDVNPGDTLTVDNTFPEGTTGKVYTYTYQQTCYIAINPNGGSWDDSTGTVYQKVDADYDPETFTYAQPVRENYVFAGWEHTSGGTDTYLGGLVTHVFTAQWEIDELNTDPTLPGGDGIPDKYQRKVTFTVVKGAWNDGEIADIVHVVTLMTGDAHDVNGTASIAVPAAGEKPDSGYQAGSWNSDLGATLTVNQDFTEGTTGTTYIYTYLGNYILVQPNGGKWNDSTADSYLLLTDGVLPLADPTRTNYTFLGWVETVDGNTDYSDGIISKVYTAQWIHDSLLVYPATVIIRLNDENTDVAGVHDGADSLQLRAGDKTYALTSTEAGVYTENVPSGTYYIDRLEGDEAHQIGAYQMIVTTRGGERVIDHYSVTYDLGDGTWSEGDDPGTQIYFEGTSVSTVAATPVREGYAFKGWQLGEKTYGPGETFTPAGGITVRTVLTAVWEKLVDVKVHVTINYAGGGGIDYNETRDQVTFHLLRDIGGAKEPMGSTVTLTETSHQGYTIDSAAGGIAYTAAANTFEDLPAGSYTVSCVKTGYDVLVGETTTDADGTQIIPVTLTFNPDSFDLYFDVQMADGIPQELWPDAVNVKVTYWGDDGSGDDSSNSKHWVTLPGVPVTVSLDQTGKGTGHYSVWKHLSGSADAYDYRVMVSGFVYSARAVVPASEIRANEVYSDGNYTATVTVPGGRTSGEDLSAAYYGTSAQVGRPLVTVTVEQYDVTFDANGGTVNGKASDTVTDVYAIPAFSGFVPTRASYVFDGWYADEACTIAAVEGTLLTGDVTLYAKWSPIQAITGNVTVEGVYTHNNQLVEVHAIDRTTQINVALQVYDTVRNTLLGTVQTKQISLTWPETPTGDGTGSYSFTDLAALPAGQSYRVLVYMTNYTSFYLNEASADNQFTTNANLAVFKADPTATYVHADLIFDPDSYDQQVLVDATAIGDGFRPANAMAQILYWEQGTRNEYDVISQHDVEPYGLPIPMDQTSGTGSAAESVWKWNWTGKLYDYRVQLTQLNGKPYTDSDPRFSVSYSDEVCWDLSGNAAPGALTITLEPNTFDVIFDMNAPGMADVVKSDAHTWSHATNVTSIQPTPTRSGYAFMGWYDTPDHTGQQITTIDAAIYADTTLYAYWVTDVLEETPQPNRIGDGIPDIYQCVVTFEITGGTWGQYGGSAPIQRVYTLWEKDSNDVWTKIPEVTLGSRIPDNMWRNGVSDTTGHWNPAATAETPVTGNATYTYTYRNAITATVQNGSFVMDGKPYTNTTHSIPHDHSTTDFCTVTFRPETNHILLSATLSYMDEGNAVVVDLTDSNTFGTYDAATEVVTVTLPHDRDYRIHVIYTPDVVGPNGPDEHPDLYQKKVNFVIQHGFWQDAYGAATITRYIPLYDDPNADTKEYDLDGKGLLGTIPTPVANRGYKLLGWDVEPPKDNTVSGTDEVTYTFLCVPTTTTLYNYNVEHWRQQPDSRYALESSEHKQVSVELNAAGTDFETGKAPTITLTPPEYKNYGIHYTPCDGSHYLTDNTHDAPVLTAQPNSITDKTLLKMYYCLNTYTLSYDLGEGVTGAAPDSSSKLYGNGHDIAAAPVRDKFVFLGWKNAETGVVYQAGTELHLEGHTQLTALWEPDVIDANDPTTEGSDGIPDSYQVIVTYQVQGGKWADGTTGDIKKVFTLWEKTADGIWTKLDNVVLGDTIPTPETSETHTGAWDTAINAQTPVTATVNYIYSFEPLPTFTVSYDLNGGTGANGVDYTAVTVVTGKTVTVKSAPAKRGYTFEGYTFGGRTYKPGDVITVTEDILLTAQWDRIPDPVDPPTRTGTVVLTKCDAADPTTVLPRVVFDLFTEKGDYVGTYTTNARGEIEIDDLRAGSYYWVETRPTEGYALDNREHPFTVSAGKTTEMTVENSRSAVPTVFSGDHYAYIIGYSDGLVQPQWKITRAEVATIFFRLLDEDTRSQFMTRSNSFSDVQSGMWFNTAVSTMASMGVINGYPNGTFQPNANITRAEFAAIAARFDANGNTTGVSFSDIYEHWAYKEISIAANNGWILGYEDGTFKPNQHITRAEAMALVNRVLQRIPEHKNDLLRDMVQWPDNMDPNVWYYLTVQEATNSHDYGRKVSGYEYWINLREVPDWTALER